MKPKPLNSVLAVMGIIAAWITVSMIPEMRRYIRIRRM
jgi:hypothetical protein